MGRAIIVACVLAFAWASEDESISLLQKRSEVLTSRPTVERLTASTVKLHKFSAKAFKMADKDNSNSIDRDEMRMVFEKLLGDGVIDRVPFPENVAGELGEVFMENVAGDDALLDFNEFVQVIKGAAEAAITSRAVKDMAVPAPGTTTVQATAGTGHKPSAAQLAANKAKLHKFSAKAFKLADEDGSNDIDQTEMETALHSLIVDGIIDRMPTQEEAELIENVAGDDDRFSFDDFEQVIKHTAEAIAGEEAATAQDAEPTTMQAAEDMTSQNTEPITTQVTEETPPITLQATEGTTQELATAAPTPRKNPSLDKFFANLFKSANVDENGGVDMDEVRPALVKLHSAGFTLRVPTPAEIAEAFKLKAGDDQLLQLEEFVEIVGDMSSKQLAR